MLPAAAALLAAMAPVAAAQQGGLSTPGTILIAENPGTSAGMFIVLTARSAFSSVPAPSCRPQDQTLRCFGSLVLRTPAFGGLVLSSLQVHRLALGDTSCSGCTGDEGTELGVSPTADETDQAVVNGLSVLRAPGSSGYPAGTTVQVKMTLQTTGNGGGQIDVAIYEDVEGSNRPLIYDTGAQPLQQLRILQLG